MTIHLDVPTWRRIAEDLRQGMDTESWPAGSRLPSEADLQQQYGCARETVRRALHELQRQGRVELRPGHGYFVRRPKVTVRRAPGGGTVTARMPTAAECAELDMPDSVPVLVVTDAAGEVSVYPADATELSIPLPLRNPLGG